MSTTSNNGFRPLIGLTPVSGVRPDWVEFVPGDPVNILYSTYYTAVEAAGGLSVSIPITADPSTATRSLERMDGLILTGGPDICPGFYGQESTPGIRDIDYNRDVVEIALVQKALAMGLPVLGICRGVQLINVALGGTLHQDVSRVFPEVLEHVQRAPKKVNTHQVHISENTKLISILDDPSVWVNSHHHQAVAEPAPELTVSARAKDGVIEAVENSDHPFFVGVQWHPEGAWRVDASAFKLFQSFVEAAAKYGQDNKDTK